MRIEKQTRAAYSTSKWLLGLGIFASCLIMSCSSPDDEINPDDLDGDNMMMNDGTSSTAPGFELTALDGATVKLSDHTDKVVVLFFFGNTCPSCKSVAPDIQEKLNEDYADKNDYVVFGLDVWDGNSNSVQSFKDNTNVTFPLLLNASAVSKSYNTVYDRLVVIDKSGKIAHNGSRAAANDLNTVKSKVDDLLK